MKYLICILLLTGCGGGRVKQDVYRFGDNVRVVRGMYTDAVFTVQFKIHDDLVRGECSAGSHQYYGMLTRSSMLSYDYICHDELGSLW